MTKKILVDLVKWKLTEYLTENFLNSEQCECAWRLCIQAKVIQNLPFVIFHILHRCSFILMLDLLKMYVFNKTICIFILNWKDVTHNDCFIFVHLIYHCWGQSIIVCLNPDRSSDGPSWPAGYTARHYPFPEQYRWQNECHLLSQG